MIGEGGAVVQKNRQILNPKQQKQQIIQLPKPKQQQIAETIVVANKKFQQLAKQQMKVLQNNKKSPVINQIRNLLSPLKSVNYKTVLNTQTLTPQKYRQFSIMKKIRQLVMNQLTALVQIQTNVDIFTHKLVRMPGQKQEVIQFVTKVMSCKTIVQMYNIIFKQLALDPLNAKNIRNTLLKPLLQMTMNNLARTGYQIPNQQFMQAQFNDFIQPMILDQNTVQKVQQQAFKNAKIKNKNLYSAGAFDNSFRIYMLKMIYRKKKHFQVYPKFFHLVKTQANFQELVTQGLRSQIQKIQTSTWQPDKLTGMQLQSMGKYNVTKNEKGQVQLIQKQGEKIQQWVQFDQQ